MKKVASLLLALMMLVVSCVALADSTEPQLNDNTEDVANNIATAINSGSAASDIFGGEDQKALMALYLPAGTDLSTMELSAPTAFSIPDYDAENPSTDPYIIDVGDVAEGKSAVAVLIAGDSETGFSCIPVKLEDINGKLVATMSPYVQSQVANGASCVIASCDTPVPEEEAPAVDPAATSPQQVPVVAETDKPVSITTSAEQTPTSQEALESLSQAMIYDNKSVAEAFGDEANAAIVAALPEGVDAATLELNETLPIAIEGELPETVEGMAVAFETPTVYEEDAFIIALLGNKDAEGNFTWTTQPATVLDGHPIVHFTNEVANGIGDDGVIAFLNN